VTPFVACAWTYWLANKRYDANNAFLEGMQDAYKSALSAHESAQKAKDESAAIVAGSMRGMKLTVDKLTQTLTHLDRGQALERINRDTLNVLNDELSRSKSGNGELIPEPVSEETPEKANWDVGVTRPRDEA